MSVNEFVVSPNKEVFLRIVLKYAEVIEKCEEHECKDFLLTRISRFLLVNKNYIEGSLRSALVEKYRELMLVNEKYKRYYQDIFGDVKESVYSFTDIRTCIQTELGALNESSPDASQTENSTEVKSFHECKVDENRKKKYFNEKGELHRTDGPAIEWPSGNKWWYQHGKRHRTDGPAIEFANGDTTVRLWYLNGKLHRTDGPAIEWADGTKKWFLNGERHRTDGPAIERADGDKEWWVNGKLHRTDGPAVERTNGYKAWYRHGELHRTDGPAIIYANGDRHWYQNGKLHRTDGPAIEFASGDQSWYHNGERHRTDGPAIDWPIEGKKEWYFEGQKVEPMFHECKEENGTKKYYNEKGELHRAYGPAIVYGRESTASTTERLWYLNGKLIAKEALRSNNQNVKSG